MSTGVKVILTIVCNCAPLRDGGAHIRVFISPCLIGPKGKRARAVCLINLS
jgi:hypothetical protein